MQKYKVGILKIFIPQLYTSKYDQEQMLSIDIFKYSIKIS